MNQVIPGAKVRVIIVGKQGRPGRDGTDSVADATASVKGKLQLAGDLGGTADAPTVPALGGINTALDAKLDDSQLDTDTTLATNSDTKIASQKATKSYVDAQVAAGGVTDATSSTKGKLKLTGDLGGTADLPTVPGLAAKEPSVTGGTTAQYYRGDKTFQTLNAAAIPDFSTAADARITAQKGVNSGLASLDSGGKIPGTQLPALAISDTFVVSSQSAMLALTAQTGDVAVRSDISSTFILQGTDPTVLGNWVQLQIPGGVASVNGQTGAVSLRLDQLVAPTAGVAFNGQRATGLADPTAPQDAATRAWVLANGSSFDVAAAHTFTGAQTFAPGAFLDKGNQLFNVKAYGAIGDAVLVTDAAITSGSTSVTSESASFTAALVGKTAMIIGAGAVGPTNCLVTTFAAYISPTQMTLASAAGSTVAAAHLTFGTNDTAAIVSAAAAITANGGGRLYFPKGGYIKDPDTARMQVSNVTVEGDSREGTVIYMTPSASYSRLLWIDGTSSSRISNVAVRNLTLSGQSAFKLGTTPPGDYYGFATNYADNVLIENVRCKQFYQDLTVPNSTDIYIDRYINDTGVFTDHWDGSRHGIAVLGSTGLVVERSTIYTNDTGFRAMGVRRVKLVTSHFYWAGLDTGNAEGWGYNEAWSISNCSFYDASIGLTAYSDVSGQYKAVAGMGGLTVNSAVDDVTVSGCNFYSTVFNPNSGGVGVSATNSGSSTTSVTNVTVTGNNFYCTDPITSEKSAVSAMTPFNSAYAGAYNWIVSDNNFQGYTGSAIAISSGVNIKIHGNNISNFGRQGAAGPGSVWHRSAIFIDGITAYKSSYISIFNNTIDGNNNAYIKPIYVGASANISNLDIIYNTIRNFAGTGSTTAVVYYDTAPTGRVFGNTGIDNDTLLGGNAASGTLTLSSTSHATKGKILFGTSAYDEFNNRLAIGAITGGTTAALDVTASTAAAASLRLRPGVAPTAPNDGDIWNDSTSHHLNVRLNGTTYQLDQQPTGSGSVTSVSVASTNGFAGTVATSTTTPAITLTTTISGLLKGNGSAISAAVAGTDYLTPTGNGSGLTGITESQVSNLVSDLALKAPSASPSFTGTMNTAVLVTTTATAPQYTINSTSGNAAQLLINSAATGDAAEIGVGFGGTRKWHFGRDTSGNFNFVETGVAIRMTINAGGATSFANQVTFSSGLVVADGQNIAFNTTTGTKIGTTNVQKIGIYGVTPVVQAAATTELGTALSNFGLRAAGTAFPITTSGAVSTGRLTVAASSTSGSSLNVPTGVAPTTPVAGDLWNDGTSFYGFVTGFAAPLATTRPFSAKTAAYTLTDTDGAVTGDATTAAFSITLPTAVGRTGREYVVKKIDASANAVTLTTTSSQTIDGSTTYVLSTQNKFVRVVSNGANWIIVGNN